MTLQILFNIACFALAIKAIYEALPAVKPKHSIAAREISKSKRRGERCVTFPKEFER